MITSKAFQDEINPIKVDYSEKLNEAIRKQIIDIIKDDFKFSFLNTIYYLSEFEALGKIHTETEHLIDKEIDILQFDNLINYFEENGLIEFERFSPVKIRINDNGIELFEQIFDISEYIIKPSYEELTKENGKKTQKKEDIMNFLNETIEYILS